jgi:hypothetical protein
MVDWKVPETRRSSWMELLHQRLPLLGHRNWICIVDAAYPLQIAPGIELIDTGAEIEDVLPKALAILQQARHVQPTAYIDAELPMVAEDDAPGVKLYRTNLAALLEDFPSLSLKHEEIIARISRAASEFRVLLLKTTLTIPYTSVFFELECGYWTVAAETRLRAAMELRDETSHNRAG